MVDFCSKELYGYKDVKREDVPAYRKGVLGLEGVDGYKNAFPIILRQDSEFTALKISQSITEIESMELSNGSILYSNVSAEESYFIRKKIQIDSDVLIRKVIPAYLFKAVLTKVRKIILEWALELEKNGIYGEQLVFSDEEQKKGNDIPSIQIIINGNVSNSNIAGKFKDSISNIQTQG